MSDPVLSVMREAAEAARLSAAEHEERVPHALHQYMTDPAYRRRVYLVARDLEQHTELPVRDPDERWELFLGMALRASTAIEVLGTSSTESGPQSVCDPEPWVYFDGTRRSECPYPEGSENPYRALWTHDPRPEYAPCPKPTDPSRDECPEWNCPDLSTEDRREGKTCPDHPCTCDHKPTESPLD